MEDIEKILNAKYKYKGMVQGLDGGIIYLYEDEEGNTIYETDEI